MKTFSATLTAFALLAAAPASAADFYAKAPPPVFNWTGPYVGAHGGYAWGTVYPPTEPGKSSEITMPGGFGGIQFGYNYQFAPNWLVGFEQDIWAGRISASVPQLTPIQTISLDSNYGGTIRARFGYVRDRVLVYSTAGIAWAAFKVHLQFQDAVQQALAGSDALVHSQSHLHFGLALGNGIEWAILPNLSIKAEYLFTYLTKEQYFSGTTEQGLIGWHQHNVRVGVNWLLH